MKKLAIASLVLALSGCASNMGFKSDWVVDQRTDQFYGTTACAVQFNDAFKNLSAAYGVRYFPFFAKAGDGNVYFGVSNNYNVPVGDVLVKIDQHEPIRISHTETPISEHSYKPAVQGNEQIQQAMQNVMSMQSPYTMAELEKSQEILSQARGGETMMIRIIGYGVNNSAGSQDGTYPITANMLSGLRQCAI
ncbi:hypothetical protein ACM25P_02615 [Vreelandella alkaliphila]|uniref:hypothetical protein n=1 Tax=Vreelandella alkaliphila TaxID=272774 RepID=UPI0039F5475F